MWNSIPPQHSICPSSLASKACLSHRRRPSTSSSAEPEHDEEDLPGRVSYLAVGLLFCVAPFFFVVSHEKCLLLCPLHPVSPVFVGPSPKEKATRRSVHSHTHDANGYQATSSDRCFV